MAPKHLKQLRLETYSIQVTQLLGEDFEAKI